MLLIGLGSNLRHPDWGRPSDVLRAAVSALAARGFEITARSRIYATAPIGPKQGPFANAVVAAMSSASPEQVLSQLQAIERDFGRRRVRRWGPRVLDLDLLAYGQRRISSRHLHIPHPGLAVRPFVLVPAQEVMPGWRHPCLGKTVRQLAARTKERAVPVGFL